ncbi:RAQPRD family integrative conjugative element protein [Pseudomonas sp. 7P_10.2_Bac1]|uniref:integrative conjugative element protein, RAQPRD family n=1 Tax=Pseudomonas sp. 7P_10.2_Bac1 TaxID=2971614 RepID=UPI0021C65416|nr:RAQPRD family integrative conjugative element protein [Pseudomonas sp. 7P_10.2_Bac1]MCU1725975.1 RAQPRD family integrative conjugative element protein [Pseudomonas sp. 7P_10.2_Bac1]
MQQIITAAQSRLVKTGLPYAYCGCGLPIAHAATTSTSEHSNLAIMIRQLNTLDDTARRSAQVADEPGQRHFIDYLRLADDIERIRHGLENYLPLSRAQPRDPVELLGSYSAEGRSGNGWFPGIHQLSVVGRLHRGDQFAAA